MNWTEATPINTTNLNDLETRITNAATSVTNGKTTVAAAITAMGQTASGTDSFATMATKIRDISDDANAVVGDVLNTKTFYQGGAKRTGNMANNGPVSSETVNLTTEGAEYTIAGGFHSGLRKIKAVITNLAASVIKLGVTVGGIAGAYDAKRYATGQVISSGTGSWSFTGLTFTPSYVVWHIYNASATRRNGGGAAFKTAYLQYGDTTPATGAGGGSCNISGTNTGYQYSQSDMTWSSDGFAITKGPASTYIEWTAFE